MKLLATVCAALISCTANAGLLPYTITDLGTLPGFNYASAAAINESGVVIGTVSVLGQPNSRAVVWKDGQIFDLGLFGGVSSSGYAINNFGVAVGGFIAQPNIYSNYPQGAFVVNQNGGTILKPLNVYGASAVDISNNGQILGGNSYWASGLADPNATGLIGGVGLNDFGVATGYIFSGSGYQAVTWNNDVMTPLGYLSAGCYACRNDSVPSDINNLGQVVGGAAPYAWRNGIGPQRHAFIFENGAMIDIHGIGGGSTALAINNKSVVVGRTGYVISGGASDQPFIWTSEMGMVALTDLIADYSDWRYLLTATDINDAGQIVGYGVKQDGQYRAFLLDPVSTVPEPGTFMLMLLGLCMVANSGRRRTPSRRLPPELVKTYQIYAPPRLCVEINVTSLMDACR